MFLEPRDGSVGNGACCVNVRTWVQILSAHIKAGHNHTCCKTQHCTRGAGGLLELADQPASFSPSPTSLPPSLPTHTQW